MNQPQQHTGSRRIVIDRDGEAHKFSDAAPFRPELAPGESISTVPTEFWCDPCAQPRGTGRCAVCGRRCRARGPDDVVEPVGELELGSPDVELVAGADVGELEQLELPDASARLELEAAAGIATPSRPPPTARAAARAMKVSPGLERLRQRAAELDAPPEPAPPPVSSSGRPLSAVAQAIAERETPQPWAPIVGEPATMRRKMPMAQPSNQRTYDEHGREVQTMNGGRRRGVLTAEDQLVHFWRNAKVDRQLWGAMAAAALSRPDVGTPEEAADLADQLYIAMIQRENLTAG